MAQRAFQAVNRPCRDQADLSAANGCHEGFEARPLIAAFGSRDTLFGQDVDDGPAGFGSDVLVDLVLLLDRPGVGV